MPHQKFFKKILVIILLVLGIVFLNGYFLNNFFQNFFYKLIEKPGIFLTDKLLKSSYFSRGFLKVNDLVKNSASLEEENRVLLGQVADLENLKRENEFLRNELGVSKKLGAQLLLAKIFDIQRGPLSSTILINRGNLDGVKKSMAVITTGNILVGIVDEVFENSSKVLVLDDPQIKVSARVEGSDTLVDIAGSLQGNVSVGLVTNKDEIKEGDVIVSSGLDGLPESLPIAEVSKVESNGGGLFKKVEAKTIFGPFLGPNLFVILH